MPRNIVFPQEQQNFPNSLHVPSKNTEKRSSTGSNFSDDDQMMESKWKTNLLINSQQQRICRRDQGYRKNTSFQNKIINDHIKVMIECVCNLEGLCTNQECIEVCNAISSFQSTSKQGIIEQKVTCIVQQNTYLTQEQCSDMKKLFTQNYDNYQILQKTILRLQKARLIKEELSFILMKIVEFITVNYELRLRKYDQKFMEQQIESRLCELVNSIVSHKNVKVINPEYFYNSNQKVYLKIIQVWFYCIFAIKLGIYSNKYQRRTEGDMDLQLL